MARVAAMLVAIGVAVPALAGTDFENWQAAIGKSAPLHFQWPGKPKGKCVCIGGGIPNRVGALRQIVSGVGSGSVRAYVDCYVPQFNETTGVLNGQTLCQEFVVLPK
jgi:hypothetical protein